GLCPDDLRDRAQAWTAYGRVREQGEVQPPVRTVAARSLRRPFRERQLVGTANRRSCGGPPRGSSAQPALRTLPGAGPVWPCLRMDGVRLRPRGTRRGPGGGAASRGGGRAV